MKKNYTIAIAIAIAVFVMFMSGSYSVMAQTINIDGGPLAEAELLVNPAGAAQTGDVHEDAPWITKWYGPDGNYENNGGTGVSAPIDLVSKGTGGEITDVSLSTMIGLNKTRNAAVEWDAANGGTRAWTVFEINPADGNNMNRGGPIDNLDTYAVIVIDSPKAMTSVMSPAHDDHAQIWINGEKWYNNSAWTGAAKKVQFNIEVQLQKGANVLLYRCSEGGGSAYFNLHFDDETHNTAKIYPDKATDQTTFFDEIQGILPVEPLEKLTTTWADIKRTR